MTVSEFVQIADQLVRTRDDWFHFEAGLRLILFGPCSTAVFIY